MKRRRAVPAQCGEVLGPAAGGGRHSGGWVRCLLHLGSVLTVALPVAAAGQPGELPRIGLLAFWPCDSASYAEGRGEFGSLMKGLEELGYQTGGNVSVECRSADLDQEALARVATELVQLPVDLIVTTSQPAGHAAYQATRTIPIVSVVSGDPVAAGLAQSLAKPGGNLTGVSYYATELTAKRLELLREAIPRTGLVGVLSNPHVSYLPFEEDTKRAAGRLGIDLKIHHVAEPTEFEAAYEQMEAEGVQAVFVLPDVMFAAEAPRIAELALAHRLPVMAWGPWFAEVGCLMAYSADYGRMQHRLAFYVDRILKGTAPGDLPIEQPTNYYLTVNLKTARALGIEMPESILLFADKVIE
jgi:putative tryptophan/tyrosine transport system substrate-binding protein